MKKIFILLFGLIILLILNGCVTGKTQRQYYKIAGVSSSNLEIDKAQCAYQAELSTPMTNNTKVIINSTNSNYSGYPSGGVGGGFASGFAAAKASAAPKRRKKKLIDLCLKSRGWQWRVINVQ